jgi:hypothetical protein
LAEHAASNRIEAARLARRFPAVLDLLAEGALNLSTARLLAPHLQPDNFEAVVAQARGRSKREVEVLVAGLAPQSDVVASVRRLPAPSRPTLAPATVPPAVTTPFATVGGFVQGPVGVQAPVGMRGPMDVRCQTIAPPRPTPHQAVKPLTPERYGVQFTVDAATREKLGRAQELLRREIPNGDPGAIFGRALDLLLADLARRKLAVVKKPRPQPDKVSRGRHVPAFVKRAVWARDGGRCAFVAAKGRRCAERTFLEFHHRDPYALGGEATTANISLRCRAHNGYEADVVFGRRSPNSPRGELGVKAQFGVKADRTGSPALNRSRPDALAALVSGP